MFRTFASSLWTGFFLPVNWLSGKSLITTPYLYRVWICIWHSADNHIWLDGYKKHLFYTVFGQPEWTCNNWFLNKVSGPLAMGYHNSGKHKCSIQHSYLLQRYMICLPARIADLFFIHFTYERNINFRTDNKKPLYKEVMYLNKSI